MTARFCLAALLLLPAFVKAYVLSPLGLTATSRGANAAAQVEIARGHAQTCICMGCRNNLKKEKRIRNRVNAFRFKKGGGPSRFQSNFQDRNAAKEKDSEDADWNALVFTYSANAAAETAEEAVAE